MLRWLVSRRDIGIGAAFFMLLTQLTFFPYLCGDKTLQESAVDAPSLYNTGSRYPPVVGVPTSRVLDAGAPAWQTEPQFALIHAIVFNHHTAPLWNPYSAFGTPLAAEMLSQPYSPFAWVPIVWNSARGFNYFVALRICAAGFFTFLFLRLFISLVPSLAGGAAFMYAGCLWLYVTMPELSVEVVTPAMLYAVERLLRRPSLGTAAVFSLFLGISFLGGMPESSLLVVTFVYVYAIARLFTDRSLRRTAAAVLRQLAVGTIVGLGLAAILLLPFLEYLTRSWSTHGEHITVGLSGDPFSLPWLVLYIAPLLNGPPWNGIFLDFHGGAGLRGFFGATVTYFALLETFCAGGDTLRSRRFTTPTLIFAACALVLLLKRFAFPLVNWIGSIPNFNRVDFPKYEEIVVACCVAVLAAFGVARVAEKKLSWVGVSAAFAIPFVLFVAVVILDYAQVHALTQHREYFVLSLAAALTLLAVAATMCGLLRMGKLAGLHVARVALLLIVVEPLIVWIVPLFYIINPQAPQSTSALLGAPYVTELKARLHDGDRFLAEDGVLFPEWSAAFAIPDVRELDGLLPERYLPFVRAFMPKEMAAELQTRFVGQGDIEFSAPLARRFLTLASVQYVGLNHPLPDAGILGTALRAHPELQSPVLHSDNFTIDGIARPGLFMHPSPAGSARTELPLRLQIPDIATQLDFSIGMLPAVWASAICGDGVTFIVESHVGSQLRPLFRRYIDPKHDKRLRHWLDFSFPVNAFRGNTVDLTLATEAGPSQTNCGDWAVWGDMRLTLAGKQRTIAHEPLTLRYAEPGAHLYEYSDPGPRIAVYHAAVHRNGGDAALQLLADPTLDIHRTAVVEGDDSSLAQIPSKTTQRASAGHIEVYTPSFIRASVVATAPSLVVINDTYFPGWQATVDGIAVRMSITDYLFRGLAVGAGKHTIEWRYDPQSFRIGAALSLLCLLEIVLALVLQPASRSASGFANEGTNERSVHHK